MPGRRLVLAIGYALTVCRRPRSELCNTPIVNFWLRQLVITGRQKVPEAVENEICSAMLDHEHSQREGCATHELIFLD
jgi:hypothetical protein